MTSQTTKPPKQLSDRQLINAMNRDTKKLGALITERLTPDELTALGIVRPDPIVVGARVLETLRFIAAEKREALRSAAAKSSPLIEAKLVDTLARGIARALSVDMGPRPLAELAPVGWLSAEKSTIKTAYLTRASLMMTPTPGHPGSRSGRFIVDLRNVAPFADASGVVSIASIAARVGGK